MADLGFDFSTVEVPPDEFAIWAAGDYPVTIIASEVVENNAKTGKNLKFQYQREGTSLIYFDQLSIINPSEIATKIARQTLKKIADATGTVLKANTDVLHGKRMIISVGVEMSKPYTNKDGIQVAPREQNKITAYKPYSASGTAQQASQAAAAPAKKNPFA